MPGSKTTGDQVMTLSPSYYIDHRERYRIVQRYRNCTFYIYYDLFLNFILVAVQGVHLSIYPVLEAYCFNNIVALSTF